MKTLKSFQFPETAGIIKAKYQWNVLLNGNIHQLEAGKDFQCKPTTFIMMVRSRAKKAGITVKVAKVENGVVIQAILDELVLVNEPEVLADPSAEVMANWNKGKGKKKAK